MKTNFSKLIFTWLPVILWALLIFNFSSGSVPVASTVYWQDFAVKKTGHVILFGVLAVFVYRALRLSKVKKKDALVWAILISTFYGATDEYHQTFTQGREARIRDVFIDGIGAFLMTSVLYYLPSLVSGKLKNVLARLDLT